MKNLKMEIINEEDYNVICDMAKKYNMSVDDFGRLLSKKIEKDIRLQVRFSADELKTIDIKAGKYNMSRSEYCRTCCLKAIKEKQYENLNICEIQGDAYNKNTVRDMKVCISFDDAMEYSKMRKVAMDLSMKFSTMVRYFALSIEL